MKWNYSNKFIYFVINQQPYSYAQQDLEAIPIQVHPQQISYSLY